MCGVRLWPDLRKCRAPGSSTCFRGPCSCGAIYGTRTACQAGAFSLHLSYWVPAGRRPVEFGSGGLTQAPGADWRFDPGVHISPRTGYHRVFEATK